MPELTHAPVVISVTCVGSNAASEQKVPGEGGFVHLAVPSPIDAAALSVGGPPAELFGLVALQVDEIAQVPPAELV